MEKRGQTILLIVIVVLVAIFAVVTIWQLTKEKTGGGKSGGDSLNDTNATSQGTSAVQVNCSELVLAIEEVDCLENVTEISVSVSRGADSLGEGDLTVYATDKDGQTKSKKSFFNASEKQKLSITDFAAGAQTKITVEFEIGKDSQKAFCPGPIKEYKCTGNETETGEQETSSDVTAPSGSIRATDQRNDASGGYFCNNTEKPEHKIRLYTYKSIDGVKKFSSSYVESSKINNFCSNYAEAEIGEGMRYDIRWEWDSVKGIDGYRIYQYYEYNETKRNYNYHIDLTSSYVKLVDTGLNLWKFGSNESIE